VSGLPGPLRPLARQPDRSALFLDYDGTLAPIVPDPAQAAPLPGVPQTLARLVDHFAMVAVVSGRPVEFLLRALDPPAGLRLAGLYGMEEAAPDGTVHLAPGLQQWRPVVGAVTERARRDAPEGVDVEAKGLTVTLHWRGRPDAQPWAQAFADAARSEDGLVTQPGRMALELRPPVHRDKGTVVHAWAPGHDAVACFGDDLGDLPAFAALGDLSAEGIAVARVAVLDPEGPPEVAAQADVTVQGPAGALALLRDLAEEA
jgi:trehalose 6-phosphate phosphatase